MNDFIHSIQRSIAVNYPARAFGVKRGMNVGEMKKLCPHIFICRVPSMEGITKGDLQKYRFYKDYLDRFFDKKNSSKFRRASDEVFKVLGNTGLNIIVEKASVDEVFPFLLKCYV